MKEKEYKDFSKIAKKGADKYARLSSATMVAYQKKYEKKTSKRATAISNKEHFYSWVSRNRIR